MSDAIVATVEQHYSLAPIVPEDKMRILGDVIAPGLNKEQLEVFAIACNRTRLDPFAKQICAISRWDSELGRHKMTIQTTIDGFRIIAERTGKYGGRLPFEWCGKDGVWKEVWLEDEPPAAARVRIVRKDWSQPIVAIARYKAYAQTKKGGGFTHMWTKMDAEQLAKCGEALGLRTAFPQELSGLYTDDEMMQADQGTPPAATPPKAAEPKQQSKPVGPVFWPGWPDKAWAGKLLTEAPANVLGDYIEYLDKLIQDPTRERLHKGASASRDAAQKRFDELLDAETERALAKADEAAKAPADAITDGIQQEFDRTHGKDAPDDDNIPY